MIATTEGMVYGRGMTSSLCLSFGGEKDRCTVHSTVEAEFAEYKRLDTRQLAGTNSGAFPSHTARIPTPPGSVADLHKFAV